MRQIYEKAKILRPHLGNLPKKFWQAFPYWGLFPRNAGKLSPTGECSKKVPAGFPQQGKAPQKFWRTFPTLGRHF